MKKEDFERLKKSLNQAIEHAEGKRNLKTTVLIKLEPISKEEIIALRNKMNCSQAVFANRLNVSPKTVQAWEQGRDTPKGAALRLLSIAKEQPEILVR